MSCILNVLILVSDVLVWLNELYKYLRNLRIQHRRKLVTFVWTSDRRYIGKIYLFEFKDLSWWAHRMSSNLRSVLCKCCNYAPYIFTCFISHLKFFRIVLFSCVAEWLIYSFKVSLTLKTLSSMGYHLTRTIEDTVSNYFDDDVVIMIWKKASRL